MPLPISGARARARRTNTSVFRPGVQRSLCALLLAVGLSNWATAQTTEPTTTPAQTLTLQAALQAAQARSYALAAQDAAALAAREMAVAAGRLPDPMLSLSVDNLPVDGPMRFSLTEDFMTMRSVGLTQTFVREGKRRARAARFEREADTAEAARVMQLAELRRDTALAWFERYYRQQIVALLTRQREEAALQIEAADAAWRAGRGAQAEVFMARSAVARIEDRIREATAHEANATTQLARWVGELATAPLGEAPPIGRTPAAAHHLAERIAHHPDIALMASKEAVVRAEADVARQDKRADWSASLMYSRRGDAFSNMVSFAVSVPLQWDQKNRQDRELAARLAQAEQARAEREEMTRAHLAETERWLTIWRSNLERLGDYDDSLIPLAGERTRAALAAYRGGQGALAAVLEARRTEIDTRLERLRIEMETAALWAELEYLIPADAEIGSIAAAPQALPTDTQEPQR
ncbi:TolC family protein [Aromatoleum toluclasticum]|uniref:TolC family protein n=1 Tax=Aromatoleum toluclasticum TaxID=92003 RepID=UPI001D189AA6|nr:TolC family protein [Aromatoleum toluclasticum]MCC4118164.1 TolC family protein [Aromatoleum toluclasticum]